MSDCQTGRPADRPTDDDFLRLVQRARSGCQEALGELIDSCRPYLLLIANQELEPTFAAKTGASDVVQDTLLSAQRCLDQFHGTDREELLAWLRGILLNDLRQTRRYYRSEGRQVEREVSLRQADSNCTPPDPISSGDTPSSAAVIREQRRMLDAALQRLGEQDREIINLRSWQRLSFREIGARLELSADAARKRWSRAILKLQNQLDDPSSQQ